MYRKYLCSFILLILAIPCFAEDRWKAKNEEILRFKNMYAVDGVFLTPQDATKPNIRGIVGDYQTWKINKETNGVLFANGRLLVDVRGLVFPDAPNDEDHFRAAVSCLTDVNGVVGYQNVISLPFPTGPKGNARINALLELPSPCVAPIVMILNGDPAEGDAWFAISGN